MALTEPRCMSLTEVVETVCIQSAFIYHLGVPKQGEGGGMNREDETWDCTFPFSFELLPLFLIFFTFFFSPKVSCLVRARSHNQLP